MSSRRPVKVDPTQATISHVFASTKAAKTPTVEHPEIKPDLCVSKKLTSSDAPPFPRSEKEALIQLAESQLDARIQAFYDSLNPREVIAHSIAVEKLGTSYDVSRTHGFIRWSKANPK